MKTCFRCGCEKPLSEFYVHRGMKDGHLNKCIVCTKSDATAHRNKNIERIREYDRNRGNRQKYSYVKEYREKYPNKYKAHNMVNNSIRDNKLFREPCEVCGSINSVAHHDDYLKPLNVRWLCQIHHIEWHKENGEGANAF